MGRGTSALPAAAIAHGLAWVAFLFLLVGPSYQGVVLEAVAVSPTGAVGSATSPTEPFTSTLIAVNGLQVLPIILFPVALTGLGLWVSLKWSLHRWLLWTLVAVLLLFCLAGIWSIGLFYLPAWVALTAAAVFGLPSRRSKESVRP